ncbi:MAG: hypothetical protein E3J35_04355 [Methanomassiliicoccales archaeon]|nr:MAG: hypothetical protein E3J35_04355 [Methanomassiliicoccales archaeon]
MLVDIFGKYPQIRVLDFLIENREYDYSISDIARGSDVGRPTLYEMIDGLIELGVMQETRRNGNARMFATNKNSPLVQYLSRFDFELSKELITKELERQDSEGTASLSPQEEAILNLIGEGEIDRAIERVKALAAEV